MKLLVFGFGFTGRALARRRREGWSLWGAARDPAHREAMVAEGVVPVDPADPDALASAVASVDAVLASAPPDSYGCPALRAIAPLLDQGVKAPGWMGYLSTTGVYGDRRGGWVFEDSPLLALSPEAERRIEAERGWTGLAARRRTPLFIFRLPGIYGPGRSPLDRVRSGEARRLVKPDQVFSRIHVDDLAAAVGASLARPARAGPYNLCDDLPAPLPDTLACAARLLGREPPPEEPYDPAALSAVARRFWAESKRVSNAKAKAALGWRPAYPTYREGLAAILATETLNGG